MKINKFHLILRILLSALFITLYITNTKAQQYDWTADDFPGSQVINIVEIDGKYYAAVSNGELTEYDSNNIYQISIYEFTFNPSGEPGFSLQEIISIPYPENFATNAIDYIEETNSWIIVQSSVISPGRQLYRVVLYDEDFNYVTSTTIDTLGLPLACHIDSYNGRTYILGSIIGPPRDELFYLKYTHSDPSFLPPIHVGQSDPNKMFWVTSMNIDKRTGNMLVFYYNGIVELDSNLHQTQRYTYNQIKTSDHGYVLGTETNYYSHGAVRQVGGNGKRWIVLHKYDTAFNILIADTFGIEGQDNYPFILKSLDHRNGELMVGGHLDGPFTHLDIYSSIKKFYLAKYDEDLNQIWYKEYGGDKAYWFAGVHLLDNGGCLAYGFITDTIDDRRHGYIMHVDENGEILTSSTLPTEPVSSIRIVNPGNDLLRIINPDGLEAQIRLYDLNGCELMEEKIDPGISEIFTGTLPASVYPYTVWSDGKFIFSGKWLKTN